MRRLALTITAIVTLSLCVRAGGVSLCSADTTGLDPKLEWKLGFRTLFDNREGDDTYSEARTYFFTQLSPEVGLSLDGGRHSVMGGVVWTQPIGCEWEGHRVSPTLYYLYKAMHWHFAMGMLPRELLVRELPNYIVSDSVRYFQRNLRSALVGYEGRNGYFQGLLDWRGMQSETRREAFCVIADGEWHPDGSMFMAGGLLMLNHLAKQRNAPVDQHVIDNMVANPYVGLDLKRIAGPFEQLSVRAGALMSLTRDRGDSDWLKAAGLWAKIDAAWWRLGLENTLYASSKPLFPIYGRYGALLNEGEPYYASSFYDRLSVSGNLLSWRDAVSLDASLDFNFTKSGMIFYNDSP